MRVCQVAGHRRHDLRSRVPTYWKNGTVVSLTDGSNRGRAYAIAIENGDVYAAGDYAGDPAYWKNGELVMLWEEIGNQYAAGIAVNDNGVHVVTYDFPNTIYYIGTIKYWNNGTTVTLSHDGVPAALIVDQDDVYVVGTIWNGSNSIAKYWKNGEGIDLTDGSVDANATGIVIDGGDVYISGYESKDGAWEAKYWKNGKEVVLDESAMTSDIAVIGDDVYVSGELNKTDSRERTAVYWKNGTAVPLAEQAGTTSIFVARSLGDN